MFEILKKLIKKLSHPRNKNVVNSDELNFLYRIPFRLPKKRWPELFFKTYNAKVTASHTIFKSFNHETFFNANKQLISFQNQELNSFAPIDVMKWIHIEQQEVVKLRVSLEQFKYSNNIKKSESFLESINTYIQSLENTLISQRGHHKTSLYLNDAVRSLLQESESNLSHIFSFLDDSSMKEVPGKLDSCRHNLILATNEIDNFTEYQAWYSKLSSTVEALENIIHGNAITYSDLKTILGPWFSGFGEGQLFLDQCIRQLFIHYVVPKIHTTSYKRLALIREFNSYWADAISDRLMKKNRVDQDNKTPSHSQLTKKLQIEISCVSKFCFWRKDKNDQLKNNQPFTSSFDKDEFENTAAILR